MLLGSPEGRPLADEVLAASADATRYRSFVGNSIEDSLGLLAASAAAVGGDTGLVHAARALGVPTIAFSNDPTDRASLGALDVFTKGIACQPCHAHSRHCTLGRRDYLWHARSRRCWPPSARWCRSEGLLPAPRLLLGLVKLLFTGEAGADRPRVEFDASSWSARIRVWATCC